VIGLDHMSDVQIACRAPVGVIYDGSAEPSTDAPSHLFVMTAHDGCSTG
jgi:hypothetical protein